MIVAHPIPDGSVSAIVILEYILASAESLGARRFRCAGEEAIMVTRYREPCTTQIPPLLDNSIVSLEFGFTREVQGIA